ncbi:MAG: flagellar basal body rod protein FlgB [Candidatus Sericytochromatia bacterium]
MFDEIKGSTHILHQALDGLSARQRITAQNLANVDTPGYQAREVRFEDQLRQRLHASPAQVQLAPVETHPSHLDLGLPQDQPFTVHQLRGEMRNDRNGVDLEQEVTRMAQAQLSYGALTQIVGGRFGTLKYVISEGGR